MRDRPHPSDAPADDQATDERTLADANRHLRTAMVCSMAGRDDEFHEAVVKAYNTVAYLAEQEADRQLNQRGPTTGEAP